MSRHHRAHTMMTTVMAMMAQVDQTQTCRTAGVWYAPPSARVQFRGCVMSTLAKTAGQTTISTHVLRRLEEAKRLGTASLIMKRRVCYHNLRRATRSITPLGNGVIALQGHGSAGGRAAHRGCRFRQRAP